jgi:hypothetical protein
MNGNTEQVPIEQETPQPEKSKKILFILIALVVVLIVVLVGVYFFYFDKAEQTNVMTADESSKEILNVNQAILLDPDSCPPDIYGGSIRRCSDNTVVTRVPPACQFAECPNPERATLFGEVKSIGAGCYEDDKYFYKNGEAFVETKFIIPREGEFRGVYANDGEAVFWLASPCARLKDADASTFEYLGYSFSRDNKTVFYRYSSIHDVDIETLEILNRDWFKDKDNVFFHGNIVGSAHPETFEVLQDTNFAKDRNYIFYSNVGVLAKEPKIVLGATPDTFESINGSYFYDDDEVFLSSYETLHPIEGADSSTFELMSSCSCVEGSCSFYAKDAEQVYCGAEVIDADPETFEYVGGFNENPGGLPVSSGIAKDKNCIFRAGEKVLDKNGTCVSPVLCGEDNITTDCGLE